MEGKKGRSRTGAVTGVGAPYIKLGLASDNHDERAQSSESLEKEIIIIIGK